MVPQLLSLTGLKYSSYPYVFITKYHRNSTEAYRVQDLRIMGDLGAFNFVQHFDMERWSEKQIKELISHSNVVYNVIGSWRGKDELF